MNNGRTGQDYVRLFIFFTLSTIYQCKIQSMITAVGGSLYFLSKAN